MRPASVKLTPGQINDSENLHKSTVIEGKDENTVVQAEEAAHYEVNIEEIVVPDKKAKCCNATPYVLMIALSVHACFEGIALGLQTTMISTLNIVLAVVIHKGAASSALGISLVKTFPDEFGLVRKLVFIFSMATPIGVTIGILASGAGELVDVIMSSLAAGTFVYIACTEIIVAEFSVGGGRAVKLLAFVCGACIISALSFIPGS